MVCGVTVFSIAGDR